MKQILKKSRKIWQIENYDEQTRRRIKAFAAANGLNIAEALTRLADLAKI